MVLHACRLNYPLTDLVDICYIVYIKVSEFMRMKNDGMDDFVCFLPFQQYSNCFGTAEKMAKILKIRFQPKPSLKVIISQNDLHLVSLSSKTRF